MAAGSGCSVYRIKYQHLWQLRTRTSSTIHVPLLFMGTVMDKIVWHPFGFYVVFSQCHNSPIPHYFWLNWIKLVLQPLHHAQSLPSSDSMSWSPAATILGSKLTFFVFFVPGSLSFVFHFHFILVVVHIFMLHGPANSAIDPSVSCLILLCYS